MVVEVLVDVDVEVEVLSRSSCWCSWSRSSSYSSTSSGGVAVELGEVLLDDAAGPFERARRGRGRSDSRAGSAAARGQAGGEHSADHDAQGRETVGNASSPSWWRAGCADRLFLVPHTVRRPTSSLAELSDRISDGVAARAGRRLAGSGMGFGICLRLACASATRGAAWCGADWSDESAACDPLGAAASPGPIRTADRPRACPGGTVPIVAGYDMVQHELAVDPSIIPTRLLPEWPTTIIAASCSSASVTNERPAGLA